MFSFFVIGFMCFSTKTDSIGTHGAILPRSLVLLCLNTRRVQFLPHCIGSHGTNVSWIASCLEACFWDLKTESLGAQGAMPGTIRDASQNLSSLAICPRGGSAFRHQRQATREARSR